jgi:glutathione S-transferase
MIDLHYWTTPNGHKITMFLEESGLPYRIVPVNIGKGDQFTPSFLKIAPNNRIPAIVDHEPLDGGEPLSVFESGAILLYLADKLTSSFRKTYEVAMRLCSGCFGRWADSARWQDRTITRPIRARAYCVRSNTLHQGNRSFVWRVEQAPC